MTKIMKVIFISYSHEDWLLANDIAERLISEDVQVWQDRVRLQPGDIVLDSIQRGLEVADVLLLIYTEASSKSFWVNLEWQTFLGLMSKNPGKILIPCVQKKIEVPPFLKSFQYLIIDPKEEFLSTLRLRVYDKLNVPSSSLARPYISVGKKETRDHVMIAFKSQEEFRSMSVERVDQFHREIADALDLGQEITLKVSRVVSGSVFFVINTTMDWTLKLFSSKSLSHFGKKFELSIWEIRFRIPQTVKTPWIVIDTFRSHMIISGRSIPEEANKFYEPILQAVDMLRYVNGINKFVIRIQLEYFNTTSSHNILKLFKSFEEFPVPVTIEWYYEEDDDEKLDVEDLSKEYNAKPGFKFEIIDSKTKIAKDVLQ
ncbi:MAG: SiaC family regulatory phosphoprotein [Flavobacteriales bacterium]